MPNNISNKELKYSEFELNYIVKLWHIKLVHRFRTFFQNETYLPTVRPQKAKARGPKARGPRHMPDLPYGKSGPEYSTLFLNVGDTRLEGGDKTFRVNSIQSKRGRWVLA